MKALHFGAGNIGRGFIGKLLADAGIELTFADVNQTVLDALNARHSYQVHVVGENEQVDTVSGVNAVSMEGTLHWVDMVGNRVAPVAFGPRRVILLAGSNKLVATPAEARERIRRIAPLNARRHEGFRTPCMHTGICADCNSPDRLCNIHMSIVKCFPKGRISVILMEEPGGL